MSILHGKVDRQPVTLHETPRHGVIPAGDPRVTAALNVVRRHYGLPTVEQVSVFDPGFMKSATARAKLAGPCERCKINEKSNTNGGTKYCRACALEVESEKKRDSARRSRECRRRRLEREAGV